MTFLKKFTGSFIEKFCVKDSILYKEGEVAEYVFIVLRGEFVVTKKNKFVSNDLDDLKTN